MTRKLLLSFIMAVALAPLSAQADVLGYAGRQMDTVNQKLGAVWDFLGSSQPETGQPAAETAPAISLAPQSLEAAKPVAEVKLAAEDLAVPQLPAPRALPEPWYEKAGKRLFCVEYARALSGLNIFGDAKYWWSRAKNLYARAGHPLEEAVMVFAGSSRLKRGHLAVVSKIVSPREIRVEQANWLNKGEIDHATPVLDVSEKNDWSKVRVWDVPSHQFGSRVYAVSGFILKPLVREASNN